MSLTIEYVERALSTCALTSLRTTVAEGAQAASFSLRVLVVRPYKLK
jgi:hypothetical protein